MLAAEGDHTSADIELGSVAVIMVASMLDNFRIM